jgi:hypothetical protein
MELIIFALAFPIFCLLFWFGICKLIMFISGYSELSRNYQTFTKEAKFLRPGLVVLGFAHFQNTLGVGLYPEGVYLSMSKLLALNLPQLLFIPWIDIEIKEVTRKRSKSLIIMLIGPTKTKLSLSGEDFVLDLDEITACLESSIK